MSAALDQALLRLVPSALELLPALVDALVSGKRQAAADAAEELMHRQLFAAAQRAKRDGRGRPVAASPAKPGPARKKPQALPMVDVLKVPASLPMLPPGVNFP